MDNGKVTRKEARRLLRGYGFKMQNVIRNSVKPRVERGGLLVIAFDYGDENNSSPMEVRQYMIGCVMSSK
jgi:hypothetical protein